VIVSFDLDYILAPDREFLGRRYENANTKVGTQVRWEKKGGQKQTFLL
jgi:hypothetical protein